MTFDLGELLRLVLHGIYGFALIFFGSRLAWEMGRDDANTWLLGLGRQTETRQFAIKSLSFLRLCFLMAFAATILSLADWSLTGHLDRHLAGLQQRFDRRPWIENRRILRGDILDRTGTIMAHSSLQPDGSTLRELAADDALSHLIGYDSPMAGSSGLEGACRERLLGRTTNSLEETMTFLGNILQRDIQRGSSVHTTIQMGLQLEAGALLKDRRGAIVVVDVRDGTVLVLCSAPSFFPGEVERTLRLGSAAPGAPLLNRCTQGRYPPGSLFKVVPAAAALEAGISPRYASPAEGWAPPRSTRRIRDHEAIEEGASWEGRGVIGLETALTYSANTYFAQLGVELGWERLEAVALALGFQQRFSFFEDQEANSFFPIAAGSFPREKRRTAADLARTAIGQHTLLITPLQLALIYATVGNGGRLYQPRLLMDTPVRAIGQPLTTKVTRVLLRDLQRVIEEGTGRAAAIPDFPIAGKTGTAENPHGKGHAWFAALAPAVKPRYCFLALIENSGYGGQVAAPIVKNLIETARTLRMFE